jgi:membrane-bound ClpP family serine protease
MWTVIIILILVGILMLLLEILVIPGTGVAGIIGFGVMVAGIWLAYSEEGTRAGHITLAITLGSSLIGLLVALRSRTWKKAMLSTEIDSRVRTIDPEKLSVGEKGITISRCAPMGKALFNDKFFEVSAYSNFIDENKEIEVMKISGNKIFVKQIKEKS